MHGVVNKMTNYNDQQKIRAQSVIFCKFESHQLVRLYIKL